MDSITVRYGEKTAVDAVTLTAQEGTALALVGPNGSGKTTLLNVLGGLIDAFKGSIKKKNISTTAYVTQQSENKLWIPLTVKEIIHMGFYKHRGMWRRITTSDKQKFTEVADRLNLTSLIDEQFWELSGGQKQRVRLAQALVQNPELLLLDEPMNGLDLPNQSTILEIIQEEKQKGNIVLVTTHNLDVAQQCDAVALVKSKLVAFGPPNETLKAETLKQTFGGHVLNDCEDPDLGYVLVEEHHH